MRRWITDRNDIGEFHHKSVTLDLGNHCNLLRSKRATRKKVCEDTLQATGGKQREYHVVIKSFFHIQSANPYTIFLLIIYFVASNC